ncbi:MAG: SUMF1/EgtB/PvdO family nonheme iron enzyme, partial [Treponema sp.]|nr:SUMF1/EgtB/PvdO family nonheme iron enzyme [Treponema sp.]
ECAAVLKSLFTNRYMNEELNESLKNISFGQLDLIIRSKCSDRIVELDEMLEIMENAARLGFLEGTDRKTFIEKIKGEIFTLGAKIDTVQSAFVRYFNDRKNIDPVNAVNSEKNRLILAKKYMEFSCVSAKIYGEEANNYEKFYIENLPSFLEVCSLKLDSPVESFKINYFAQFKNSHNISVPLPASDFSELQAGAIMYGLSQDDWKNFLSENSIFQEVIDDRQAEIDALNAKIAELEKMQNAMNAASKQTTTSTTNSTNSVNSSNLIEGKSQNEEIIRMVEVQGGAFMRDGFEITLSKFKISEMPVTQELYEKIVRRNPSNFKGADLPVEQVSWLDAIKFCNLLSRKEGLKLCYKKDFLGAIVCDFTADGYRLPTEAEWEFAARGGEASLGFRFSGSNNLNEAGWYCVNSKEKTREVKKRKANEIGLFDMSGNVWEWCNDFFAPYPAKPLKNPRGQPTGDMRVARGGSWNSTAEECSVTSRASFSPAEINSAIGFRIVRSV